MSAYAIIQLNIKDQKLYEKYKAKVPEVVAAFGGRYLARGGEQEVVQGTWPAGRTVILEFSSIAAARIWHESDEYSELRAIRDRAAEVNLVIIEGVPYLDDDEEEE